MNKTSEAHAEKSANTPSSTVASKHRVDNSSKDTLIGIAITKESLELQIQMFLQRIPPCLKARAYVQVTTCTESQEKTQTLRRYSHETNAALTNRADRRSLELSHIRLNALQDVWSFISPHHIGRASRALQIIDSENGVQLRRKYKISPF